MSDNGLPPCKYGGKCYRKNPQHFQEYSHPTPRNEETEEVASLKRQRSTLSDNGDRDVKTSRKDHLSAAGQSSSKSSKNQKEVNNQAISASPAAKRNTKLGDGAVGGGSTSSQPSSGNQSEMPPSSQVSLAQKSSKYSFYMTYIHRGVDSSYNQGSSLTLHNVINGTKAELQDSCLFSYMYDIDWIRQQYKPADRNKPMTLVEGLKGESRLQLLEQRDQYSNIKIVQAKLDIMYGVHHTKMIILRYNTGIRIMITTANLIPLDWFQKSQALWCSALCPPGEGDSDTCFKADLIEYLTAYRSRLLNEWIDVIKRHDMSKCRVFLIASVPGRHLGEKKELFGHLKLRKVLRQHGPNYESAAWPVIGQFSSIGSLGSKSEAWLTGEFMRSLTSTKGAVAAGNKGADLKLIYPTKEDVRTSLEGYQAGGSLPFNSKTYDGQRFIRLMMHKWRSECRGRTGASPHIKSYLRLSPDKKIPWFLMTSSNLSKAAWGCLEKSESQLMIRSYELGVLFVPKMFDKEVFTYDPTFADESAFPVPFDLSLTPYDSSDEPWLVDKRYTDKRDSVGEYWNPYS